MEKPDGYGKEIGMTDRYINGVLHRAEKVFRGACSRCGRETGCGCGGEKVQARLTEGSEIYPHRKDLYSLPFWKCDACGNFVGCHHKTKNRTQPLGCIPTPELKMARQHIHRLLDPIWQSGKMERKELYAKISARIGWQYHTAQIRTIEEARQIYRIVREYA